MSSFVKRVKLTPLGSLTGLINNPYNLIDMKAYAIVSVRKIPVLGGGK